jgi:hypothetical protein
MMNIGVFAEGDLDSWQGRVCSFVELLYNTVISDER